MKKIDEWLKTTSLISTNFLCYSEERGTSTLGELNPEVELKVSVLVITKVVTTGNYFDIYTNEL